MTIESTAPSTRAEFLRGLCGGAVHLPGDPGYDEARTPWNLAHEQRPAAVVYPGSADEVVEVVRAVSAAGLRIAPQGTGHNAGPLGPLDDVVLLRTSAMTKVTVDPERRIARAESGALWLDAVEEASKHNLTALHGSSPDVGIAGYSLGGGMGWYARKLGLATHSVTALELVLADGSLVRASAEENPDLYWALRGGGGNFGVVTAIEFRLFDFDTAYAGMLVWDGEHDVEVLRRWVAWSDGLPEEVTTSFRILNFPPLPELPEEFRGRRVVMIDGAVLDSDEKAEQILAPLRELSPEIDTFGRVPTAGLVRLHMDPEEPVPAVSSTALLDSVPEAAIQAFVSATRPENTSLDFAELRQLGGALGRPHPNAGVLEHFDGNFVFFAAAVPFSPEEKARGLADTQALADALAPYATGSRYLNFAENPVDVSESFPQESWARLRRIRAAVDPHELFLANHPVPGSEDALD